MMFRKNLKWIYVTDTIYVEDNKSISSFYWTSLALLFLRDVQGIFDNLEIESEKPNTF